MTRDKAQTVCRALTLAVVPRAAVRPRAGGEFEVFVRLPQRTPAGHLERALKVARAYDCEVWLEHEPLGLRLCDRTARTLVDVRRTAERFRLRTSDGLGSGGSRTAHGTAVELGAT